jgi:hypothetical protein
MDSRHSFTHGNAEDEGPVADVVLGLALVPHALHRVFDDPHGAEEMLESVRDRGRSRICRDSVEKLDGTLHQWSGVLDHVDMSQDEASFGRCRIQPSLKGTDEAEVAVLGGSDRGVGKPVVE